MSEIKAQFSRFLELPCLMVHTETKEDIILRCRINPTSISSYIESTLKSKNGEDVKCVTVFAGQAFNIDMSLEEFDKLMKTIDRGISFEDPS